MKKDKNLMIKDLAPEERPRERLINYGAKSLSDEELIAIIIRTGNKEKSALELARAITSLDDRGLAALRDVTLEELNEIKGIGRCKAAQILAALELGKRLSFKEFKEKARVSNPQSIANIFMDKFRFKQKEHFCLVLLDTKNQIISTEEISIGTLNASIVHPRDVFKISIKRGANSIILVHNHPSGDPSPSKEDLAVTERLVEVGKLVGINVLDHIIVGDNKYLSFREEGYI